MTAEDFRRIALSFPETSENAHMNHPDFRVGGRIFATLHYPDEQWGMVKLPPDQQEALVEFEPETWAPVKGAWGRQGCTNVRLKTVKEATLHHALSLAWQNAAEKKAHKTVPRKKKTPKSAV